MKQQSIQSSIQPITMVINPKTGRILQSPVTEYYRSAIREAYGEEMEKSVMQCMAKRIVEMDEGEPTSAFTRNLSKFVYPVIGFEQGLEHEGVSKEEACAFAIKIWKEIPDEIKQSTFIKQNTFKEE